MGRINTIKTVLKHIFDLKTNSYGKRFTPMDFEKNISLTVTENANKVIRVKDKVVLNVFSIANNVQNNGNLGNMINSSDDIFNLFFC